MDYCSMGVYLRCQLCLGVWALPRSRSILSFMLCRGHRINKRVSCEFRDQLNPPHPPRIFPSTPRLQGTSSVQIPQSEEINTTLRVSREVKFYELSSLLIIMLWVRFKLQVQITAAVSSPQSPIFPMRSVKCYAETLVKFAFYILCLCTTCWGWLVGRLSTNF